jgi:hypothetical protein
MMPVSLTRKNFNVQEWFRVSLPVLASVLPTVLRTRKVLDHLPCVILRRICLRHHIRLMSSTDRGCPIHPHHRLIPSCPSPTQDGRTIIIKDNKNLAHLLCQEAPGQLPTVHTGLPSLITDARTKSPPQARHSREETQCRTRSLPRIPMPCPFHRPPPQERLGCIRRWEPTSLYCLEAPSPMIHIAIRDTLLRLPRYTSDRRTRFKWGSPCRNTRICPRTL